MTNPKRETAILQARRAACATGKAHCVFNLNPYSPLYVVRAYEPRMKGSRELEYVAHPETTEQGG